MSQMSSTSVHYPDPVAGLDFPKQLELKYLQVVFRHGERAPVKERLGSAGIPKDWKLCNNARRFFAQIKGAKEWSVLGYERKTETPVDSALAASSKEEAKSGVCIHGELTDIGRITTRNLGEYLRERYINKLGFLPDKIETADGFYMRSTPMARALESLQHVFAGLYPDEKRPGVVPTIYTRNWSHENLLPNENNCPRLVQLYEEFAERAAKIYDPLLAGRASEMMSQFMNGQPVRVVSSHPRLSGLLDTINAAIGNRLDLHPNLVDEQWLRDAGNAVTEEWFGGYKVSKLMRQLGAGSLLNDLYMRMESQVKADKRGAPSDRLALYGAHDVTLAAILASLDAFDYQWPPFTSHLELELFKDTSKESSPKAIAGNPESPADSSKQVVLSKENAASTLPSDDSSDWYVRLTYNSNHVVMGACRGQGYKGNETICPLSIFKDAVRALRPEDYHSLCKPVKK
ncbi:acid phosphatase [Schizosaccharomyces cryophilus OY26]|uniref:Acid phosphatase n=1 Tax=Schizosaccharomyces cryophilus (strain OY26 / ATCC MYA-4695 / CBS 11777 / NBRC 106824 / NRRL Y48691) TaxID=653667 RepID=S9WXG0_SCHCR|nr:acid phosphatase [Schizosaccharomyces cryophilus OY26]EPY49347.1 acid phosphatase [Schizosaccharomyces cryophilus OY26]